ncbi:MAG: hypothetical protein O6945_10325, partial [Gammaproteobacteria bacterium]|nr:hypothetical protein [Gammaproteobacteria bacterium]
GALTELAFNLGEGCSQGFIYVAIGICHYISSFSWKLVICTVLFHKFLKVPKHFSIKLRNYSTHDPNVVVTL